MTFANPHAGWATGEGGVILATTDGGASWAAAQSGTDADLYAVTFAGPGAGWAVGEAGVILRINPPDLILTPITGAQSLGELAEALDATGSPDVAADADRAREIEAEIDKATGLREALASLQPTPAADSKNLFEPDRVENWAQRFGVIILLMFLVTIFSTLYRYSLRMAAFYDGRADALTLDWMDDTGLTLAELAAVFGPESIDFARVKSPSEQAVELARAAIEAAGRSSKAG